MSERGSSFEIANSRYSGNGTSTRRLSLSHHSYNNSHRIVFVVYTLHRVFIVAPQNPENHQKWDTHSQS